MLVAVERKPTMDHGGYDGGGQCLLQFFFFFPVQRHAPVSVFFPSSFASFWFFSFWSLVFPSVSCSLFPLASSSGFLSEMLGLQWSRSLKLWNCYWRRSRGRAFCFSLLFVPPLLDSPLLFSPILPLFLLCFLCFFSFFFMHSSPSVFFFFLPPRLLLSSGFYSQRMQTFSGNRVTVAVHGGVRHAPWLKRLHYRC